MNFHHFRDVLVNMSFVSGSQTEYVGSYRVTDSDSLSAVMDVSGRVRTMIEVKLSPGPSLSGIHRHGDKDRLYNGVRVASGNFLAAKVRTCCPNHHYAFLFLRGSMMICHIVLSQRRGVVDGIDYASTGEVKKIDVSRIRQRLDQDSIVLISDIGYSSSGEVLNCKYAINLFIGIFVTACRRSL